MLYDVNKVRPYFRSMPSLHRECVCSLWLISFCRSSKRLCVVGCEASRCVGSTNCCYKDLTVFLLLVYFCFCGEQGRGPRRWVLLLSDVVAVEEVAMADVESASADNGMGPGGAFATFGDGELTDNRECPGRRSDQRRTAAVVEGVE